MERLGRYEIVGILGRGRRGVVYDAVLSGAGGFRKAVALRELSGDPGDLREEVRLGGLLRHPHLVEVYAIEQVGARWVVAMERAAGGSLRGRLLAPGVVAEIGLDVCAAVAFAARELGLSCASVDTGDLLLDGGRVKVALGVAAGARAEPMSDAAMARAVCEVLVRLVEPGATGPVLAVLGSPPGSVEALAALLAPLATAGGLAVLDGSDAATGAPPRAEPPIVGRRAELAELLHRLEDPASVTLKGAPGIGKSRLARALASAWPGPVAWCDLAAATDGDDVLGVLARELGVRASTSALASAIAARAGLLVVCDGCDRVAAGAAFPAEVFREGTRLVSTSRTPLGLAGERVVELDPLGLADAVALLAQRSGREPALLYELAARLDGVPLAIELAAARLRVMTPAQVAARLDDRLAMLRAGGRSMRAALDAAWDLLDPHERIALGHLAVFAGPFTIEAAEAVLHLGDGAPWVVDLVGSLVDHSLLFVAGGRFRMLEVVRDHAAEQVPIPEAAVLAHGAWCARWGSDEHLAAMHGPGGQEVRRAVEAELADLIAAARRAIGRGDAAIASRAIAAAWEVVTYTGPAALIRGLCDDVLALGIDDGTRCRMELARSHALRDEGDFAGALGAAEAALAAARSVEDERMIGVCTGSLASAALRVGDRARAVRLGEEAVALHRGTGHRRGEASALANLGVAHHYLGDLERARGLYEQAHELSLAAGDEALAARASQLLGAVRHGLGDHDEAIAAFEAALRHHERWGDAGGHADVLANLGIVHHNLKHYALALPCYERALVAARSLGRLALVAQVERSLGVWHCDRGDLEAAAVHTEAALDAARATGDRFHEAIVLGNLARIHFLAGRTEAAEAAGEQALAVAAAVDDGGTRARALVGLAQVDSLLGRLDAADGRLTEAAAIYDRLDAPAPAAACRAQAALLAMDPSHPSAAALWADVRAGADFQGFVAYLAARAQRLSREGRSAEALADVRAAEQELDRAGVEPASSLRAMLRGIR